MTRILCRLGWHRPLFGHEYTFTDALSGKFVYYAQCPCGKRWMVDSLSGMFGIKVKHGVKNEQNYEVPLLWQ